MNELIYTICTSEDKEKILNFSMSLVDKYENLKEIHRDKILSWNISKLDKDLKQYTKIISENKTIGYYKLSESEDRDEIEFDDFYILENERNKGYGHKILSHIISTTDKNIFLYVFKNNDGAIKLYESFGFEELEDVSPTRKILILKRQ